MEKYLFVEILKHTPIWVFVFLVFLLVLGYLQSKYRVINKWKISILPLAMIALSLNGVVVVFGTTLFGILSWFIGIVIAVLLGLALNLPKGVTYSVRSQSFVVPGSWLPLLLMMAVFFTKYIVGVIWARKFPIIQEGFFVIGISILYGFLSGMFLARALVILGTIKQAGNSMARTCEPETE